MLVCIMIFLFASVAFDMAQIFGLVLIFFCYLDGVYPNGWMTSFLPFSLTFLGVGSLALRLISGKQRIIGLSLLLVSIGNLVALLPIGIVLVLFDQQPISFRVPEIDFLSPGGGLEAGFCFYINNFLFDLVPYI